MLLIMACYRQLERDRVPAARLALIPPATAYWQLPVTGRAFALTKSRPPARRRASVAEPQSLGGRRIVPFGSQLVGVRVEE
jgi:hypothetical protein